ncbi:MAG: hypothetical protein K0S51_1212 [Bacillales bacterium]|nr:hypothetical protein [Bacillales bacterium]
MGEAVISFKTLLLLAALILVVEILIRKVFKIKMSIHKTYEFNNKQYETITKFIYKYFILISFIISIFLNHLFNVPAYIMNFCMFFFIALQVFIQGLDQKNGAPKNKFEYFFSFAYSGVVLITGITLFFFLE